MNAPGALRTLFSPTTTGRVHGQKLQKKMAHCVVNFGRENLMNMYIFPCLVYKLLGKQIHSVY